MDAYNALVSDVISTINDWLNTRGGEVNNLALSLINRARAYLWQYKAWTYLTTSTTLSLDSSQECSVPTGFGRVYRITNSATSLIPVYSFRDTDLTLRYDFVNTVDIDTGIARKFKFFNSQTSVYLEYIQLIENVTANDEFLLFPANLVLRAAQWLYAVDEQQKQQKIDSLYGALKDELRNFQHFYHADNVQMRRVQRDYDGNIITNSSITMNGD